jgi:hypothetical protein
MTTKEDLIEQWMSSCQISREVALTMLVEEANGYRRVHPEELGHLTAQQARALERSERGHPAETVEEEALYSSILADAGVDEAPFAIASMS